MKTLKLFLFAFLLTGLSSVYAQDAKSQTGNSNENFATLHIYRNCPMGFAIVYDLFIEDRLIGRVKNKWYVPVRIYEEGVITLWAKTEVKKEQSVFVEFGKDYYVRCCVSMGAFVGHPHFELVDEQTGKSEIQKFSGKKKKNK